MQLNLEPAEHAYVLRGADGRSALVNDRRLTSSFVIAPGTLLADWTPPAPSLLTPDALQPLLAMSPDVVVLGTGAITKLDVSRRSLTSAERPSAPRRT